MKRCKFCSFDERGDLDGEYIIDEERDNFYLFAAIFPNTSSLSASVNYKSEEIVSKDVVINYCPMCGRKLNDKESRCDYE